MSRRRRKLLRQVIGILISFIFFVLLLEVSLRIIDPLGMVYFNDMAVIWSYLVEDQREFGLPEGEYTFSHWSATMLPDRTRRIPNTHAGDYDILFIGDSVTFGYGVNDDQTWVDQVAAGLPENTHVRNAAMPSYNTQNVRKTLEMFPDEDLYVFLTIPNDVEDNRVFDEQQFAGLRERRQESYLRMYLFRVQEVLGGAGGYQEGVADILDNGNTQRFTADMEAITADQRVLIVSFDDVYGAFMQEEYGAQLIEWYTKRISQADPHADPEGNRQIAEQILPIVRAAVEANTATAAQ